MISIICFFRDSIESLNWCNENSIIINNQIISEVIHFIEKDSEINLKAAPKLRVIYGGNIHQRYIKFSAIDLLGSFILLSAADDKIISLPDDNFLTSLDSDSIGVSPFNLWKSSVSSSTSNSLDLRSDSDIERYRNYLSPPNPGDNSCFYGIFKKNAFLNSYKMHLDIIKTFQQLQGSEVIPHANDWGLLLTLLKLGKIQKCYDFVIARDETPPSDHITKTNFTESDFQDLFSHPMGFIAFTLILLGVADSESIKKLHNWYEIKNNQFNLLRNFKINNLTESQFSKIYSNLFMQIMQPQKLS